MIISHDEAEHQIKTWLDQKKVFNTTRQEYKDSICHLVDSICSGVLVYNPTDNSMTHELLFPLVFEDSLYKLKYHGRLTDNMLKPYLGSLSPDDDNGRFIAVISALTDQPRKIIRALDTLDKNIAFSVCVFYQ